MHRIRLAFVTLFTTVTVLWLTTAGVVPVDYSRFWPLRADMVHYSGALAITAMSAAIYLPSAHSGWSACWADWTRTTGCINGLASPPW